MAVDYSGLFASPESIRQKRIEGLMGRNAAIQGMGGSMSGLLGQVAAGTGGMLAEGLAGAFGLQTDAERKAQESQEAIQSIKAEPGSKEYYFELSNALKAINPEAAMQMMDKALQKEQMDTENDMAKERIGLQREQIDVSKEQLKVSQATSRIATAKFKDEQDRNKAYTNLATAMTSDSAGLKGLGFDEEMVTSISEAEDKSLYVPMIEDRIKKMAAFTPSATANNPTAPMKNYDRYNQILKSEGPEEAAKFMAMIRGGSTEDTGSQIIIYDAMGNEIGREDKTLKPNEEVGYKKEVKAVEGLTEAAVNYLTVDGPKVIAAGKPMLDTIANVRQVIEGLDAVSEASIFGRLSVPADDPETGEPSALWRAAPSQANAANSYLKQLRGQAFLQAFQMLKGGGPITNLEGSKAEQSLNRLADRVNFSSKQDALKALEELENGVKAALNQTDIKMRENAEALGLEDKTEPKGGAKVLTYDPDTGEWK